jgi:hypothetical protein
MLEANVLSWYMFDSPLNMFKLEHGKWPYRFPVLARSF